MRVQKLLLCPGGFFLPILIFKHKCVTFSRFRPAPQEKFRTFQINKSKEPNSSYALKANHVRCTHGHCSFVAHPEPEDNAAYGVLIPASESAAFDYYPAHRYRAEASIFYATITSDEADKKVNCFPIGEGDRFHETHFCFSFLFSGHSKEQANCPAVSKVRLH